MHVYQGKGRLLHPGRERGGEVGQRLLATSGTHTHGALEGIVDPPLEASQSTWTAK